MGTEAGVVVAGLRLGGLLRAREDGRVVGCGGLWDRGRHVREYWRNTATGEERVVARTALMDFGFAEGREDAMASLLRSLVARSASIGRPQFVAPIDGFPALVERLAALSPTRETWLMGWEPDLPDLKITQPYTDLAYI